MEFDKVMMSYQRYSVRDTGRFHSLEVRFHDDLAEPLALVFWQDGNGVYQYGTAPILLTFHTGVGSIRDPVFWEIHRFVRDVAGIGLRGYHMGN